MLTSLNLIFAHDEFYDEGIWNYIFPEVSLDGKPNFQFEQIKQLAISFVGECDKSPLLQRLEGHFFPNLTYLGHILPWEKTKLNEWKGCATR